MKAKQMEVSEFSPGGSELLADCVCEVTGKGLAKSEATTVEVSVQTSKSNTIGTGVRYIGPGQAPTGKQANDLIALVLAEIKKWGEV